MLCMSLPLQEFVSRITRRKIFFKDKFPYPGYQRFILPCDGSFVGRRPTRLRKTRAAKPKTAYEKPLAPRVKFPLQEFFLGNCRPAMQLA